MEQAGVLLWAAVLCGLGFDPRSLRPTGLERVARFRGADRPCWLGGVQPLLRSGDGFAGIGGGGDGPLGPAAADVVAPAASVGGVRAHSLEAEACSPLFANPARKPVVVPPPLVEALAGLGQGCGVGPAAATLPCSLLVARGWLCAIRRLGSCTRAACVVGGGSARYVLRRHAALRFGGVSGLSCVYGSGAAAGAPVAVAAVGGGPQQIQLGGPCLASARGGAWEARAPGGWPGAAGCIAAFWHA